MPTPSSHTDQPLISDDDPNFNGCLIFITIITLILLGILYYYRHKL